MIVLAELTRVVYTVQEFDRASADHSSNMNQKTGRERCQGEKGELLQVENSSVIYSMQNTLWTFPKVSC